MEQIRNEIFYGATLGCRSRLYSVRRHLRQEPYLQPSFRRDKEVFRINELPIHACNGYCDLDDSDAASLAKDSETRRCGCAQVS
jgi:hypothetical protein